MIGVSRERECMHGRGSVSITSSTTSSSSPIIMCLAGWMEMG